MNAYCHIVDGVVSARAVFDGEIPADWPDAESWVASDEAQMGWSYSAGVFAAPVLPDPPVVVPSAVSARQFRLQLLAAGVTDQVETWVGQKSEAVQLAYQYSGSFLRSEPMMQEGFQALGFSDEQVNAFYLAASKL